MEPLPPADRLQRLELALMAIAEAQANGDALPAAIREQLKTTFVQLKSAAQFIRELQQRIKPLMIADIQAHGRYQVGEEDFYVAPDKSHKPRDTKALVVALLDATAGDLDAFCACLASDAIKPGAAKDVLGEDAFARLFETIVKTDLKGKPIKALQTVNRKFIRSSPAVAPGREK
jgi:hypothetical protein